MKVDAPAADTFARRYCALRGIAPGAYAESVLTETLYPHARLLRRVLPEHHFISDRLFVARVSQLRERDEFANAILDFREDHAGHTWPRDVLRLRVSVRRMRSLMRRAFP